MIDLAKARALCEAQYGAKSDPEVFRAAALDLLPEALDALEQERAVCVTITTALKQAIVERDALDAENRPAHRHPEEDRLRRFRLPTRDGTRGLLPLATPLLYRHGS